jgi:probable addiction module antidote protein
MKTHAFDSAVHLDDDRAIAAYLDEALASDDPAVMAYAIGQVARARGMGEIARASGLTRESLYKALSETGNPAFSTVVKVMRALGLSLKVTSQPSA